MSSWRECKLGEVVDIGSSKRIFYNEYVDYGIPFYRSKEIIEKYSKRNVSTELFITNDKFQEIKNKYGVPQEGDILLTSVGTLGIPYIVDSADEFYFKDGNLTWFKNFSQELFNLYLYYWIISPLGKNRLLSSSIGSTQSALTIQGLKNLDISLPSFNEQKAIANILSSLDKKIELLKEQNKTLETMAQTIFKEWFINNEAKEEWEKVTLGDVMELKYGKDHKNLADGKIPVYGSGGIMRYADKAIYDQESILIPRKGTLNNIFYVDEPFWTVDTIFWSKINSEKISGKLLFEYLKTIDFSNMNVGSAVPSLTTNVLNAITFALPSIEDQEAFKFYIDNAWNKIAHNKKQIQTLEKLRDTLLPRLMSGKHRVDEYDA